MIYLNSKSSTFGYEDKQYSKYKYQRTRRCNPSDTMPYMRKDCFVIDNQRIRLFGCGCNTPYFIPALVRPIRLKKADSGWPLTHRTAAVYHRTSGRWRPPIAPKPYIFPKRSKSATQIPRILNLQRINCCTFTRLRPNSICECKPQSSLLHARFLSYGLCQHTCRCALRHERQANAALTRADQQLCAARTDQEGIRLTQIHRAVRDAVVFTAHKR